LDISYTCLTTHLKEDTSKTQAIVFSQNEKKSSFFSYLFFFHFLRSIRGIGGCILDAQLLIKAYSLNP